eukprot:CAMPEP_0116915676 /NCGR_PEP_ID=MMETSP0467-20121206/18067_1 /TAXON_ID=283647 /ORGANISM="Mesodinium pulex, Strain SPMC105" /LENGTH=198 /DNA_ID=CAMNT_0004592379 /DNA_START=328 /DNA_END=924 /DNA_ORIENTATION=+
MLGSAFDDVGILVAAYVFFADVVSEQLDSAHLLHVRIGGDEFGPGFRYHVEFVEFGFKFTLHLAADGLPVHRVAAHALEELLDGLQGHTQTLALAHGLEVVVPQLSSRAGVLEQDGLDTGRVGFEVLVLQLLVELFDASVFVLVLDLAVEVEQEEGIVHDCPADHHGVVALVFLVQDVVVLTEAAVDVECELGELVFE